MCHRRSWTIWNDTLFSRVSATRVSECCCLSRINNVVLNSRCHSAVMQYAMRCAMLCAIGFLGRRYRPSHPVTAQPIANSRPYHNVTAKFRNTQRCYFSAVIADCVTANTVHTSRTIIQRVPEWKSTTSRLEIPISVVCW